MTDGMLNPRSGVAAGVSQFRVAAAWVGVEACGLWLLVRWCGDQSGLSAVYARVDGLAHPASLRVDVVVGLVTSVVRFRQVRGCV